MSRKNVKLSDHVRKEFTLGMKKTSLETFLQLFNTSNQFTVFKGHP
jgi:hypothetical protein